MTSRQAAAISIAVVAATGSLIGWAPSGRVPIGVQDGRNSPAEAGHHDAQPRRSPVTFTADVAPILFNNCSSCHRPEGIAPFPLLTYDDARSHASTIVEATRARRMPPWKPEPGYGEFLDARVLTEQQISTLSRWVDDGLVQGNPALLPSPPAWTGQSLHLSPRSWARSCLLRSNRPVTMRWSCEPRRRRSFAGGYYPCQASCR